MIDLPPVIETLAAEIGSYVFRDESILGTRLQVMLVARSFAAAKAAALAARAEIDRLDLILNTRLQHSELSVLNRSRVHRASAELFDVIGAAEQWRVSTHGAFSGRIGRVIELWRRADRTPSRTLLSDIAQAADQAHVELDLKSRMIIRPDPVRFALDAFAKGWIVDRAFDIALAAHGVTGALIDIGGDIRSGGRPPGPEGWRIGIPDPRFPQDNAPLIATANLVDHGIATSGRGPRDREIGGHRHSPTLSPYDGWPVTHHSSATVIASSTATADALATSLLVLPEERGLALAESQTASARIARSDGTASWTQLAQSKTQAAYFQPVSEAEPARDSSRGEWNEGWQALATFTAPRRQLIRDPDFRSPYMAMWITDINNRPVRTLLLIGKRRDWQKDNFIWWSINREATERLCSTRSMSTSGAGVYNVFWDGLNDANEIVPAGQYVLHVETSRERGKHTYRSLTLDFGTARRFVNVLAPTEEGGGLRVSFDHY